MLNTQNIPQHIAVIMDGNGRWAAQHHKPRVEGHRAGADVVREITQACKKLGVRFLTLYAFSSENWNRPPAEVEALMTLLNLFLEEKAAEMDEMEIRFKVIGQIERLPEKTQQLIERTINLTSKHNGLTLVLALSYGGREEIVRAVKRVVHQVQNQEITSDSITTATFSNYLDTADIPDPDLLIRTSGEMRLSNFLLWQLSYSELVITEILWPDFREANLLEAIQEYQKRHRRFGSL